MRCALRGLFVITILCLVGCASEPINPSFSVTRHDASAVLREIAQHRQALDRPLVIVGGFSDPGIGSAVVAAKVRRLVADDRIVCVNVFSGTTFQDCRRQLIDSVSAKFPGQKVDVIGLSMGGLVARYAATGDEEGEYLPIARLFTISSPHRGAKLASIPTFDQKVVDMRPGSKFLSDLAMRDATVAYELFCYTRLGDDAVGEALAAPPGKTAWWVSNPAFESAHLGAMTDDRIVADIILRLRGESPLTSEPPAPLPQE